MKNKQMTKYFKIWIKRRRLKKIMCLYVQEVGDLSPAQILFDKLPYGMQILKHDELKEAQFERAANSRFHYKNLEKVLDEKDLYN